MTPRSLQNHFHAFGVRDGIVGIAHAVPYLATRYVLRRPTLRRRVFDYTLELDARDPGISKTLAVFGKRELEHRAILTSVLKSGMTCWDIGANIGYYAIMEARLVGPQGKVYAVEPAPANVALLRRNIAQNNVGGIVEAISGAVSNCDGTATFHLSALSNVHSFHPVSFRTGERVSSMTGKTIPVRTFDVPTFLCGRRKVDLVRMDIEGHEVEVFEAIARAVRAGQFRGMVLFETHFPKYDDAQHNMRDRFRELVGLGYRPRIMASTERGTPRFLAAGYAPSAHIRTDGEIRTLFTDVRPDDAERFLCDTGGVRTILLACGS
ncbi:MAG: FkbM family methyltransferase [bacterium]|nr:FkbM family methyltransferase [bacterium]